MHIAAIHSWHSIYYTTACPKNDCRANFWAPASKKAIRPSYGKLYRSDIDRRFALFATKPQRGQHRYLATCAKSLVNRNHFLAPITVNLFSLVVVFAALPFVATCAKWHELAATRCILRSLFIYFYFFFATALHCSGYALPFWPVRLGYLLHLSFCLSFFQFLPSWITAPILCWPKKRSQLKFGTNIIFSLSTDISARALLCVDVCGRHCLSWCRTS